MKKIFILFISFFCIQSGLHSQYYQSKVFYRDGYNYQILDLVKDDQQNIYLAGENNFNGNGLLLKLDSTGAPQFIKIYDNSSFTHVLLTKDSMLLLSGEYTDTCQDAQVTKCDLDGNVQWSKRIDFGSGSYGRTFSAVQCYDSSYVFCGTVSKYPDPDEVFVSRISETGSEIWTNAYVLGNRINYGISLIETSDSGIVVCGSVYSNSPSDGGAFLMKLDMNGDTVWSQMYNTDFSKMGTSYDLIEYKNAIYFICSLYDDITMVKCDLDGSYLFAKQYNNVHGSNMVPESSAQLEIKSNGNLLFTTGCFDYTSVVSIIEADTNGNLINFIDPFANGAKFIEMNNKHLFVFGNGPLMLVKDKDFPVDFHFVLYESDSLGYNNECMFTNSKSTISASVLQRNCPFVVSSTGIFTDVSIIAVTSAIDTMSRCAGGVGAIVELKDISFTLYPNPTNQILNVSFSNAQGETGIIEIFSTTGALLYSENLKFDNEHCLNIDFLPPGMYLLSLRAGEMKGSKWFEVIK